ncbi:c-type cytochrome [Neobacillus cucumis]|uniref:Cytochrome C551 n=1 Tax=Neobacillus cucumis TaxID=1740721 RepID=A0A2N5HB31_9BACI|nr:cytochrome c [Neobacillus cucumis]PLS02700.1 cytochrome C551 [Neobacillus cucumis]
MKKILIVAGLSILLLAGCSSKATDKQEALDGETLYGNKCSACHGGNLKGAVGPSVLNMISKYTEDELYKMITEGSDKMPGHLLNDEESRVVTKWLMEKK